MAIVSYFLAENFFDARIFPNHTITGEDETTGYEGHRVGNRRRNAVDYYTPQTANAGRYVQAACDRVRYANMLVIDRGSNLEGETVRIQSSNQSAFTTYAETSFTVPSITSYGSGLVAGTPVRTEEGAIVLLFDGDAARYWRIEVDAMGSGLKPEIVGAWLGNAWSPTSGVLLPADDEPRYLEFSQARRGYPASFSDTGQENAVTIFLTDIEDDVARWNVRSLLWSGAPMWVVFDTLHVERAWLAHAPPGTYSMPATGRRGGRDMSLTLAEYQPRRN